MNLVIIGRFPAATDTQIRAFLPADREVFITESDLSGPFLQSADALIPEHIPIPSFGDKALKLRMIQTGAGYGEDRAVCFTIKLVESFTLHYITQPRTDISFFVCP